MNACIAHKRHLNSSNSPLLKLPVRVKETIYTYVLTLERPVELNKKSVQRYMSLLKVCAQIRRKATPIFYSTNAFRISNIFSEAVNFLKYAKGRISRLYLNFNLAPNKLNSWDDKYRKDLMHRVHMLPDFLLTWDVDPKAVIVEQPMSYDFFTVDSAREYIFIKGACDDFEAILRDFASRPEDVKKMKLLTRKVCENMNKMKAGMTEKDAIQRGPEFYNTWKNTHIPSIGDENDMSSKKKRKARKVKKSTMDIE